MEKSDEVLLINMVSGGKNAGMVGNHGKCKKYVKEPLQQLSANCSFPHRSVTGRKEDYATLQLVVLVCLGSDLGGRVSLATQCSMTD